MEQIPSFEHISDLHKAIQKFRDIRQIIKRTDEFRENRPQNEILDFLTKFVTSSTKKSQLGRALRIIGSIPKGDSFNYKNLEIFLLSENVELQRAAIHSFANSNSKKAENILLQNVNKIGQNWQRKYVVNELIGISSSIKTFEGIIEIYRETRIPDLKEECIKALQYLTIKHNYNTNKRLNELLKKAKVSSIGQILHKSHKRVTHSNWFIKINSSLRTKINKKRLGQIHFSEQFLLDLNSKYWVTIRANYFNNSETGVEHLSLYQKYYPKFVTRSGKKIVASPSNGVEFESKLKDLVEGTEIVSQVNEFLEELNSLSEIKEKLSFEDYLNKLPSKEEKTIPNIRNLEGYVNLLIQNGFHNKVKSSLEKIDKKLMEINEQEMRYLLTIKHDY